MRLHQPTMTAHPTILYITTTPGKQKRQIPMNQILSMSNGILLQACTSLALPIDQLLLWVEVRPMIPSRPCSKVSPPYSKVHQMQMQTATVDHKRGIFEPSSIQQLISTAQNLHLRIRFLTTIITTFTTIIAHGLPAPVCRGFDRRSQRPAVCGLRTVPMHPRTNELRPIFTGR